MWPTSVLGWCWRSLNITTDMHHVRPPVARDDVGYRSWSTKLCARIWRAQMRLKIYVAMIPSAEATIHPENVQSSNNDHWWSGPAEFTRNWKSSSASKRESMVSMTRYWDTYKVHIPKQWPMVVGMAMVMEMVMMMMISEQNPPSMLPSHDEGHTIIGDFTKITVSDSDYDLHLVRVTCERLNGWMPDIPEVEIWRMVSLWMFLLSPLFSSLNFLLPFISAQNKWCRHWFLPPPEICQVEVKCSGPPDPPNGCHTVLIGSGTYGFVHLGTLDGCWIISFSFLLLNGCMQPRWSAPKEGDIVMAWLHVMCSGPGNTRVI